MFLKYFLLLCFVNRIVCSLEDLRYWKRLAEDDIHEALENRKNNNVAKNIILFIGDGMDLNTVTTSRIYKEGEDKYLKFEKFPNIGLLKTYSNNKLVPDSGSTGTALFTGVKVNHRTIGVSPNVLHNDCETSSDSKNHLQTIINWAQEAEKSTGFVTTTRVTHATPAALYAHVANRNWECDAKLPETAKKCKDIAKQLIEDEPGKNINVIFGGGRQCLISDVKNEENDPTDGWACYSKDGRNLIHEWEKDKQYRGVTHTFVENKQELYSIDVENNDFVLGIFANSHMYMRNDNGTLNVAHPIPKTLDAQPSLKDMTTVAIKVLQKNEKGYLLMVEGGLIDYSHHRGHARSALQETAEFSDAVEVALRLTKDQVEETLIIVTSDHGHSLVFTGYADRKEGVLGIAMASKWDKKPFTTLLYGTGGPNNYQYEVINGSIYRKDPSKENTTSYEYSQQTGVVTDETTHSGSDVVVYATGPMAHLFNSVHEQTYVAFVIAYSARIGPYRDVAVNFSEDNYLSAANQIFTILTALLTVLVSTALII